MSSTITTSIDIDAPVEQVWKSLTDFPNWPEWSDFHSIEGEPVEGGTLKIRMPGMAFTPTLTRVDPNHAFAWTGTAVGRWLFRGQHTFTLDPNPDGTTRLTNREEFTGLIATISRPLMQRIDSSASGYAAFNRSLKRHVEHQQPQK